MPVGTPTNVANAEIETQPLTAETKEKQENAWSNSKPYKLFNVFHSLNLYVSLPLKNNFLFHLIFYSLKWRLTFFFFFFFFFFAIFVAYL